MTIKTRKEVREKIKVVLNAAMVGVGLPVQETYDYMATTFGGKSPVIVIGSSGMVANPEIQQFGGDWFPVYWYEILSFVARDSDEAASEDELDLVAQKLYETLEANQTLSGWWEALSYSDRSTIVPVAVGGDPYWLETTVVQMEVFG